MVGEVGAVAVRVDIGSGNSGAGVIGVKIVKVLEFEEAELVFGVETSIEEIESEPESSRGVEVGMPMGEEPGVFLLSGVGVGVTTEHDAVAVLEEKSEVGSSAWDGEVSELFVEWLDEVGEPEVFFVSDFEGEVFENDGVVGEDGEFFCA